jgi:hypothetical protein
MADGPQNVNVTGVNGDVIRQITEAQTQGMQNFVSQMDKVAKSIETLTETLPKAVADAIRQTATAGTPGRSSSASKASSHNEQGAAPTSGEGQSGGGNKQDFYKEMGRFANTFMPRYADQKYTLQDYGNQAANMLGYAGEKMQQSSNPRIQAYGSRASALAAPGDENGNGRGALVRAANDFAPTANMAYRAAGASVARGINRTALGQLAGANPETGDAEGPFGIGRRMNIPGLNAATTMGAALQTKAIFDGRAAGINKDQAGEIMGGVLGMGYKPASAMDLLTNPGNRFSQLTATQESLFRRNENLVNPQEQQLLDQATRFGGTSEIKAFRASMQELANVSDKTGVSIAQMQSAAAGYTNVLANQGARNPALAAVQGVNSFTSATGLPGEVNTALQQNGLVKANQMVGSGLAPWQLGLMNSGTKNAYTLQTLKQIEKMVPKPPDKYRYDPVLKRNVLEASGRDQQLATISMMSGQPVNVIKKMLGDAPKTTKAMQVEAAFGQNEMGDFAKGSYVQSGNAADMRNMVASMRGAGATQKQIDDISHAGDSNTRSGRVKQFEAWQRVEKKLTGDRNDPNAVDQQNKVQLDLTPAAKQILAPVMNQNKANANAGGTPTVQNALESYGSNYIAAMLANQNK